MSRNAALVGHAVVGWAACGATIAVGRQFLSMSNTLIVHTVVAPVVFALLSMHFFRDHRDTTPLKTGLVLVAIVIGLDAFVVAPIIEHSYAMFRSPLGTWIPFASMWLASFLVGHFFSGVNGLVNKQCPREFTISYSDEIGDRKSTRLNSSHQ